MLTELMAAMSHKDWLSCRQRQNWAEDGKAYATAGDRALCRCTDHQVYGSTTQYNSTSISSLTSRNISQSTVPAQQAQDSGTRFQCVGDDG